MKRKPNILNFTLSDYFMFYMIILFIVSLGFVIYSFFDDVDPEYLALIFAGVGLLSAVLYFIRLVYLRTYFENGVEVNGELTKIWFYRSRGGIQYTYEYNGNSYKGRTAIIKNGTTKSFYEGMPVTVIVNKDKPKRTLIKNLFFDEIDQ